MAHLLFGFSNLLVKKDEHLAAEEPDLKKKKKAKRRAEVEMTFIVWLESPNDW